MYEEQIAAGAAWLDERDPGWELRIDTSTLQLDRPCDCVLGQLYGNFNTVCREDFGASPSVLEIARGLGFLGVPTIQLRLDPGWEILTQEWITFIKQRLNEGVDIGSGSEVLAPTV